MAFGKWDYSRIELFNSFDKRNLQEYPGWRRVHLAELCFFSFFMYKFIVSCYYWPAGERGLRLRASIIKEQFAETGYGLDFARLGRLPSLDKLASSIERRRVRRLKARCEIELMANSVAVGQRRPELRLVTRFPRPNSRPQRRWHVHGAAFDHHR